MEKIKKITNVKAKHEFLLLLTDEEARALNSICVYGPDEFVKWFYRNLGKHYLKPHENGMRSLFDTVKQELPEQLAKIDDINKFISEII